MTLLRFDGIGPKRSGEKKTLSIILGAGALVATIALGSTLAANISLNGGGTVEFGQGVAQTTACDDNIFITPEAPFINDAQDATFLFNAFSVTDISEACFGKTFTIKIYKDGQDGPLPFYDTNGTIYSEIRVKNDNGIFSFVGGGLTSDDIQGIPGGFYVTIGAGTLPSFSLVSGEDIDRITIESSDNVAVSPIGQIGPGGGTIFYYSEEAFTSTGSTCNADCHYLEVAPANWSVHNNEDYFVYSDERIESQPRTPGNESGLADERVGWRIGVGMANTLTVALENANSTSGKIAARNALAYAGPNNTVGQWFVPSMNELNELCKFANSLPSGSLRTPCTGGTLREGFSTAWYWSSSEWGSPEDERASMFKMMMTFSSGQYAMNFQSAELQLRPIRAF